MRHVLSIVRRTTLVPSMAPVAAVAAMSAWLASFLVREVLGSAEGFADEVRQGSLSFAAALALSLAEPLEVGREARGGFLVLRAVRTGTFGLLGRWLGLIVATLPVVVLAAVAGGGPPSAPLALVVDLAALAAGGLALGAWFDRARLVPALWCLLLAGHLRPWLMGSDAGRWVAWALPELGAADGLSTLGPVLLWSAGALLLADWRLRGLPGRGP